MHSFNATLKRGTQGYLGDKRMCCQQNPKKVGDRILQQTELHTRALRRIDSNQRVATNLGLDKQPNKLNPL